MDMDILTAFVQHLDAFVRTIVPKELNYIVSLDGHSSRNGMEWVDVCSKNKCEIIKAPANTLHFLQPCDQVINKRFHQAIRQARDDFNSRVVVDTRSMRFNLVCAAYAMQCLTVHDIRDSFCKAGLFPFRPELAEAYKTSTQKVAEHTESRVALLKNEGPGSRLRTVQQRQTDTTTFREVAEIIRNATSAAHKQPSRALRSVALLLRTRAKVNSILIDVSAVRSMSTTVSENLPKNTFLDCGAPAEHVTVEGMRERQREKADRIAAEKQRKKDESDSDKRRKKDELEAMKQRKKREKDAKAQAKRVERTTNSVSRQRSHGLTSGMKRRRGEGIAKKGGASANKRIKVVSSRQGSGGNHPAPLNAGEGALVARAVVEELVRVIAKKNSVHNCPIACFSSGK